MCVIPGRSIEELALEKEETLTPKENTSQQSEEEIFQGEKSDSESALMVTENKLSKATGVPVSANIGDDQSGKEWYQSKSWNVFVTTMAIIAVCWITTLIFALLFMVK